MALAVLPYIGLPNLSLWLDHHRPPALGVATGSEKSAPALQGTQPGTTTLSAPADLRAREVGGPGRAELLRDRGDREDRAQRHRAERHLSFATGRAQPILKMFLSGSAVYLLLLFPLWLFTTLIAATPPLF